MPANPYLAETLLRASRPTFELGLDIRREEEEEERLWGERARGLETRERKFGEARGRGRWGGGLPGGILGFMLGGPAGAAIGAGLGSYAGQRIATKYTPGAMKEFERIGPGKYYVSRGREREREFEFGEEERNRYVKELMLTSAAFDALSGYRAGTYGPGILKMMMGGGGTAAQLASAPGRNIEIMRQSLGY